MATKTDVSNVYQRQRSNSDPQNAIDALNALNVENDKRKNGEMKSSSLGPKTPPPERKSKFAALGKIFKPWKWKRKKKSESIVRKAVDLERKISMRSTREELIRKGVLKEAEDNESHLNNLDSLREKEEDSNNASIGCTVKDVATINQAPPSSCESYITIPPVAITSPLTTVTMSSSNTPRQLVSAAQVRPVVISMQPRKPQELSPPTLDHVQPHNIRIEVCYDQKPDQLYCDENTVNRKDEDGDEDDSTINNGEQYDNIPSSSPYEAVPAKEPDFSLLPKKSALKQNMGPFGDQQHSPSPTESRQVEFSTKPVQIISSSLAPQSTAANQVPRPSLRVTVTADDDSDKENVDDDNSSIPDYDNLPGDDYDSSDDDDEIRYIEKNPDSLAAKVARQDSLARFLNNRPTRRELVEKNIIPTKSEKEKQEDREAIGTKLTRRLSLRPTPEELEQRNILHNKTAEEQKKEKEEKKRFLIRKLSFRPSVDELKERKIIKFNDYVEVTEAHDYDRRADKPWTRLTPKDKAAIRKELNEYKSKEMEVHQESRHLTRFHRP